MVIELYAITAHPAPPLPEVAPLRLVVSGSLAGVCGAVSEEAPSPEALLRHERIVEALMEDRNVLPVRYGTRFPDDAAAARALDDRHDELAAGLEQIRGAVELAVRVLARSDAGATARREQSPTRDLMPAGGAGAGAGAGAGTAYMRARMRDSAGESEATSSVHEPLRAIARTARLSAPALPGELLRVAYLVDDDAVDAFTSAVRRVQDEHPSLLITCTGPWPPYSFAER
ncbi:MAG: GvpL/GvpF family gas vesicle protein [Solirubrobacteraceae bacterium]